MTLVDLCRDAGVLPKDVYGQRYGALVAVKPGSKVKRQYTRVQLLAIRMAKLLESRFGITAKNLEAITSTLWNMDERELLDSFATGKNNIIVVGEKPFAELLPSQAVQDFFDYARQKGVLIEVFGVCAEHEWKRITAQNPQDRPVVAQPQ